MPSAETVAIVSVAVSGAVGIGTPLLASRRESQQEERRFRNERLTKDLDELREVLDNAAEGLSTYIDAARDLAARYAFDESNQLSDFMPYLTASVDAKKASYVLNRRLVIRLGRGHYVVKAYGVGIRLLDEAATDIATRITKRTSALTADTRDERLRFVAGQEARDHSFYEANDRYLDAATKLVGSPIDSLNP
jgi:prefoldin subunit 5